MIKGKKYSIQIFFFFFYTTKRGFVIPRVVNAVDHTNDLLIHHRADGGAGAVELANAVVEACASTRADTGSSFRLLYPDDASIKVRQLRAFGNNGGRAMFLSNSLLFIVSHKDHMMRATE